jgi:colanic acid/amylovoran biosynthesis glycosyltransferase
MLLISENIFMMHPGFRMPKKLAYLVNQYPTVSHTFIRREIHALEDLGFEIERVSVRDTRSHPRDEFDRREAARTHVLLEESADGAVAIGRATLARALRRPARMLEGVRLAWKLGRRSERGPLVHLAYLAEAARLVELLESHGIEHVHAHFGTNSATVALLAQTLGGPGFSFTAHGPEEFDKPDSIGLAQKISRARFVVGVSSFGKSQILRRTERVEWGKVHVVPCGVDEMYLDDRCLKPIPVARRLVCVGRICEQKGQLLLLQAAAILHDEGEDFELVLVGDGEMRRDAEETIRQRGLERRVRITGWADGERVRDEINAARCLVLPSFAEGLPVVLMEALALKRPVISTYVAGIPELVENGRCGWLVPAGDVGPLVVALREALRASPEELEVMGAEGRRRVLERYDASKSARLLGAAFATL